MTEEAVTDVEKAEEEILIRVILHPTVQYAIHATGATVEDGKIHLTGMSGTKWIVIPKSAAGGHIPVFKCEGNLRQFKSVVCIDPSTEVQVASVLLALHKDSLVKDDIKTLGI